MLAIELELLPDRKRWIARAGLRHGTFHGRALADRVGQRLRSREHPYHPGESITRLCDLKRHSVLIQSAFDARWGAS